MMPTWGRCLDHHLFIRKAAPERPAAATERQLVALGPRVSGGYCLGATAAGYDVVAGHKTAESTKCTATTKTGFGLSGDCQFTRLPDCQSSLSRNLAKNQRIRIIFYVDT